MSLALWVAFAGSSDLAGVDLRGYQQLAGLLVASWPGFVKVTWSTGRIPLLVPFAGGVCCKFNFGSLVVWILEVVPSGSCILA